MLEYNTDFYSESTIAGCDRVDNTDYNSEPTLDFGESVGEDIDQILKECFSNIKGSYRGINN